MPSLFLGEKRKNKTTTGFPYCRGQAELSLSAQSHQKDKAKPSLHLVCFIRVEKLQKDMKLTTTASFDRFSAKEVLLLLLSIALLPLL